MKKSLLLAPLAVLISISLTACGTSTPASTAPAATAPASASAQTAKVTKADDQFMTIQPGLKLGSDGKLHDSFSPADLTIMQGVPTKVTVLNYDDGAHDLVAKDLKLNVQIPGSTKKGVPSTTTFTVTADKTGDFHWLCDVPCDGAGNPNQPGSNKGWAMANDGFMAGKIHVVAPSTKDNVAMTILPGTKLGPDGKLHDIFSNADLNLVKGEKTTVTVYNYDDGAHDFVAKDLNLNVQIPGSKKKGDPSVTTFTITADKAGNFHWDCNVQCDGQAQGWAMANDGYMAGVVHVQ